MVAGMYENFNVGKRRYVKSSAESWPLTSGCIVPVSVLGSISKQCNRHSGGQNNLTNLVSVGLLAQDQP